MEKYLFISYSSKDYQKAFQLKTALEAQGFDVWIAPNDIPVGQHYANIIEKAIKNATSIVLTVSNNICMSMWINKEVERAINYRKHIFGIKLEEVELNDEFKFLLSNTQMSEIIDSFDLSNKSFAKVIRDIKNSYDGKIPDGTPLTINKHSNVEIEKTYTKAELIDIAQQIVDSFIGDSEKIISTLSTLHFSDVNKYVKEIYKRLSAQLQQVAIKNLCTAYDNILLDKNISGRIEYAIKGQIVYYLTRLNENLDFVIEKLKEYYGFERNIWQRQSIAYGLASHGEPDIPFDFGEKIYYECDEATVNRSWTLVFFGDVTADPYIYIDDGSADWKNARSRRIDRLKRDDNICMCYRAMDLGLLYSFYNSRNWVVNEYDYKVIKATKIKSKILTKAQIKLLKTIKKNLCKHCKASLKKAKRN